MAEASFFDILRLIASEWGPRTLTARIEEPDLVMNRSDSVEGFDSAGADTLRYVYRWNALALSLRLPPDGTLLDLGCGSGRFIEQLLAVRPDLRILGLDLSDAMLAKARSLFAGTPQIGLIKGDISRFSQFVDRPVDAISCLFSLHHLPSEREILQLLAEMKAVRRRCGAALFLFDHCRPKTQATSRLFAETFSPPELPTFRLDSENSLNASFTFEELRSLIRRSGLPLRCARSALLPFYQWHWLDAVDRWDPLLERRVRNILKGNQELKRLSWIFSAEVFTNDGRTQ